MHTGIMLLLACINRNNMTLTVMRLVTAVLLVNNSITGGW
jgi:hypothetical protein